jgi:hypothetical protein
MRSLHLGAIVLASTAMALPHNECFKVHSKDLAEYTNCGNRQAVSQCLSSLSSFDSSSLESCYIDAGCSPAQATQDVDRILTRCHEYAREGELRKRFRAAIMPVEATKTIMAPLVIRATTTPAPTKKGADCFSTKEFDTTKCDVIVDNGSTKTNTCTPAKGTSSDCLSGWICTVDGTHADICMKEQTIDTSGIVIAIVFASLVVVGIGYLTFACCRERMAQTQDHGDSNPFQDQPGHA